MHVSNMSGTIIVSPQKKTTQKKSIMKLTQMKGILAPLSRSSLEKVTTFSSS